MRIEFLPFVIYIVLLFFVFPKIALLKYSDLSNREMRLLLAIKIIVAIISAFYFEKIALNGDYVIYNEEGKIQYDLLLSKPVLFFTDFTGDLNTYGTGRIFETAHSFWSYLTFNLAFKFIAILNLLSGGNFYLNSIIFSSIVFFAHVAFYRIYSEIIPGNKLKLLFACFFLPSLLLYTSCVHKDGIIFLGLGIICYIFYRVMSNFTLIRFRYVSFFLLAMAVIFLFRNYVIIALVPAMVTAVLCKLLPYKRRIVFLLTYTVFSCLFFLTSLSSFNLPAAVVQRKADFDALPAGNTDLPMNELHPTIQSFVLNFPQAVNHYLFRPYLWEFPQPAVLLTAIELLIYQMMILAWLFFRKKQPGPIHNFNIFALAFVFNMMLIIGYTIPNVGAIVRYRSIFWLFLLCPILCNTDWKRLTSFRKN